MLTYLLVFLDKMEVLIGVSYSEMASVLIFVVISLPPILINIFSSIHQEHDSDLTGINGNNTT